MEEETKNTEVKEPKTEAPRTKKRRIWPWIVSLIALVILIPILVLGFLGFVPGLSGVLGANKPKDLGVKWTAADFASYQEKTSLVLADFANAPANPNKPGKKIVFANPKQMDVNLTQEEITATINSVGWLWMPIKNAQVRLGNGTLEVSGNINAKYITNFVNFIGGVGYSQADVDKAAGWARFLAEPAIYIKANASVTKNVASTNVTEAKIGRFSIPTSSANKVLTSGLANISSNATSSGFSADSVTFKDGQMHFTGVTTTKIYVKKN
jgi:hypothetical protein